MKGLVVAVCFAAAISVVQADSFSCRWVGRCSTPGHALCVAVSGSYTYAVHDAFGLRTIEVMDMQSPTGGADSYAQDSARRAHVPGGGDYVAEAGGALLGGALVGAGATVVLGVAGAALLSNGSYEEDWGGLIGALLGGAAGAAVGYPLGCGLGTTLVGRATHADGNTGGAYAGAYIGLLTAIPAAALTAAIASAGGGSEGGPAAAAICVAALLPPAGAVIGYNTGAPSALGARLAPPTLAHRTGLGPDRQRYSAFDCRLVTVRF